MNQSAIVGHVLVVDDEKHIRSALQRVLTLLGLKTDQASSGAEALTLLERTRYDAMVLDMRMPGVGGAEVMRQVQHMRPGLPIVVLTGYATLASAIAAVKLEEVVDYLIKPVRSEELAAAVSRALAIGERRKAAVGTAADDDDGDAAEAGGDSAESDDLGTLRFVHLNPLTLDRQKRVVISSRDETWSVALTKNETAFLGSFMARPDHVFSCAELAQAAWGHKVTEEDARGPIRSSIFRLRRKLERPDGSGPTIRTVRGGGYLLVPG